MAWSTRAGVVGRVELGVIDGRFQPMAAAASVAPMTGTALLSAPWPAEMMAIVLFLAAGASRVTLVLVPLYPAVVAAMAAFSAVASLPAVVVWLLPAVVVVADLVLELQAVRMSPDIIRTAPMRINAPLRINVDSPSPVPLGCRSRR